MLDGDGNGYISNVIAAIDYAIANRARFNIRVVNLSVAAGVYESYNTDPLTLAARRAVEAGIVVVTAAGNFGRNAKGQAQNGGVDAPGNAPWVLTVGATSHNGTVDARRRLRRAVQLARPEPLRSHGQAGPRRAGRRHRIARRRLGSTLFKTQSADAAVGHGRHRHAAVSEPDRHEHGGAGRGRHRSR